MIVGVDVKHIKRDSGDYLLVNNEYTIYPFGNAFLVVQAGRVIECRDDLGTLLQSFAS